MTAAQSGAVAETVAPTIEPQAQVSFTTKPDAKASAQLRDLFNSYMGLRRNRPKFPAEAVVLKHLAVDSHESIKALLTKAVDDFHAWVERLQSVLFTMFDIGESNPGASISVIGGKSKRVVQVNGIRLYEALLRIDAEILSGSINA